jgi:tetratricopeptide (TPR) repeat protein
MPLPEKDWTSMDMTKPETIRALLSYMPPPNFDPFSRTAQENSRTAFNFIEANRCYIRSNQCLQSANNYFARGCKKKARQALDNAITHARLATSHFVNFGEAYENIASAHLQMGDFNSVVELRKELECMEVKTSGLNFYGASALFNLALQATEIGNSTKALILLSEAATEVEKGVSATGATWQMVAVLTQVFALKVRLLSQGILTAGLDSSEAQSLREALDCQIVCAEKLEEIKPGLQTSLKDLRKIRLKLQPRNF